MTLEQWFRFEVPDRYLVTGLFELELHERQADCSVNNAIWKELAAGECLVTIEAAAKKD